MKTVLTPSILLASVALFAAAPASAQITPGGSLLHTVDGSDSIYQIEGNSGSTGGHTSPDGVTDAVETTFLAAPANVFTFSAVGTIGCCGGIDPTFTPDGSPGATSIAALNGLSGISGNSRIPLVGLFTDGTDPFGGVAPAALGFDSTSPASLSPLLNQVFYIGDGLTGHDDALGSMLHFTAPGSASKLFLGTVDSFAFGGPPSFFGDNPGSFRVTVKLLPGATGGVPEPSTWAMMIVGFGLAGAGIRVARRRSVKGVAIA